MEKEVRVMPTLSGLVLLEVVGDYKLTLTTKQARDLMTALAWTLEQIEDEPNKIYD